MLIRLVAVGRRMPAWVETGVHEYVSRLPQAISFEVVEIAPGHRARNADLARAIRDEGDKMLAQVPEGAEVVALDERGAPWSTRVLATRLEAWRESARPVALLVGGPDGLAPACHARASSSWSLSALTLPHPLVRIVVAEQLYRAWTILNNHPYHRE